MYKKLLLFITACLAACMLCAQLPSPYLHWSFDEQDGKKNYNCPVDIIQSPSGSGIDLRSSDCILTTAAFANRRVQDFSIAFLFRGKTFQFLTYGDQHLMLQFSYNGLVFRTTHEEGGKPVRHQWVVPMQGTGLTSYTNIADDQWHLLVFTYQQETGEKRIWIDGTSSSQLKYNLPAGSRLIMGRNDGFRNTQQLDEIAFYNVCLSGEKIGSLAQNYGYIARREFLAKEDNSPDPVEFAPGYPNDYTISTIDQLKQFPLPRYKPANKLNRNINWMDISYLHRQPDKGNRFAMGKTNPEAAVELSRLLSEKFNYYIDIPVLRWKPELARAAYKNPSTLYGALVQFANQRPELPVSALIFQSQLNHRHKGGTVNGPYVLSQDLPAQYYMRNRKGDFIMNGRQKILSPLMNLDIIQKDAAVTALYLKTALEFLKNKPALINENGEVFGHFQKASILLQDPAVAADFKARGLTEREYAGRFQYRRDSVYKHTILKELGYNIPAFSFYNISAIKPDYWPDYSSKRTINAWSNGKVYPTPDFYPRTPDNWAIGKGAFNGYGNIAEGRKKEIELGDRDFSPFVAAGWNAETANIRPAQWLALLKAMVMLGAEHFYTGYFNITGAGGKWPNGIGPYDPRGYIYQAALPAYAQAIRSLVPEFFEKGSLIQPNSSSTAAYRFNSWADNHLILVRKYNNQYLIYGSIQPNNNYRNNVPKQVVASIQLEGRELRFPIRRQGSMYILNNIEKNPSLIQLDSWHQFEHPYYWTKNIRWEAELFAPVKGNSSYQTNGNKGLDFAEFKTFLELAAGAETELHTSSVRTGTYRLTLKTEKSTRPDQLIIQLQSGRMSRQLTLADLQNKGGLIELGENTAYRFIIRNQSGNAVLIDYLELEWIQ